MRRHSTNADASGELIGLLRPAEAFGLLGLALGGVMSVFGLLLYVLASLGGWTTLVVVASGGLLVVLSAGYLLVLYQTDAVVRV